MKSMRTLTGLAAGTALFLAGCGSSTTTGSATTAGSSVPVVTSGVCSALQIGFETGSVPAPHHYTWTLEIADGTATLTLESGMETPVSWEDDFPVTDDELGRLCAIAAAHAADVGGDQVGGATGRVRYIAADGTRTDQELKQAGDLEDEVAEVVPDDTWAAVHGEYETWEDEHDN